MQARKSRRAIAIILAGCAMAWSAASLAQELAASPTAEPAVVAAEKPAAETAPAPARSAIGDVADTGVAVGRGVGEAVGEVGGALKGGGVQVIEQTRSLWREAILPMLQRFAAALPGLIKALLLLLAFWVVARLVGAGVTKLLGLTHLDDRAASEWGLESMLKTADGRKRSIEALAGAMCKWIILLFGLVAFFNALNLSMVAGPLQNVVDKIVGVLPNLLKAAVILFVYWAVAALARLGVTKALSAAKFDERAGKFFPAREIKGEKIGPSALFGRLLFYLILLFGIPPFLQALGQEALVAPLQDMLGKALAFLPNAIAAAIIFFVGRIVAVIVREVVTNFLAAAGADAGAERLGVGRLFGEKKLSGIAGVLVYFFIIVPIVVAALDALQVSAISDPVKAMLEKVLAAVPAMLFALVIVVIGYAVAKAVGRLVEQLLGGLGFDTLPARVGLDFLPSGEGKASLSSIVGKVVMVVILLVTAQQAAEALHFGQLAGLLDTTVRYLPRLFAALAILLVALGLGKYVGNLVAQATAASGHGKLLATVTRCAILFLGIGMALDHLGVARDIVSATVWAVLGGVALALGLAFGLGGKDKAKQFIDRGGA